MAGDLSLLDVGSGSSALLVGYSIGQSHSPLVAGKLARKLLSCGIPGFLLLYASRNVNFGREGISGPGSGFKSFLRFHG